MFLGRGFFEILYISFDPFLEGCTLLIDFKTRVQDISNKDLRRDYELDITPDTPTRAFRQ